jgi:hypothetical protein
VAKISMAPNGGVSLVLHCALSACKSFLFKNCSFKYVTTCSGEHDAGMQNPFVSLTRLFLKKLALEDFKIMFYKFLIFRG